MFGKFEQNPLNELYLILESNINSLIDGSYKYEYDNIDSIAKAVLLNNGCKFTDEIYSKTEFIMDNTYGLYFIIGGIGNSVNTVFDFIEFNGINYLVIFLDKFEGINSKPDLSDPIKAKAAEFMGKSDYFNMICKIVNIFISTTTNPAIFTSALSTTSAGNKYRFAPAIIASKLIKDICGELNDNDVEGVDFNFINDIVDNSLILPLYGIYKM